MWLDTKIAKGVLNGFAISKGKGTICPQFADNIVEDICQLNDCNFGRKFAATTLSYICLWTCYTWHVCQWLWSAEEWPGLNLTACYDHTMFASQQPSDCDFLRGVCLHCRKIGMIYMHYWKQKAWAWISAMWLQVVMSISRCTLLHNVWPLVVWSNILVTSILPNLNIGWPTIS